MDLQTQGEYMSDQDNTQVSTDNDASEEAIQDVSLLEPEVSDEKAEETSENKPAEQETKEEEKPAEETEKPEEPTEEPVKPETDEEKEARRHNYEMAQKRIQERDRKQLEQKLNEAHKPPAVSELAQKFEEQGYTQFEAEMLARDEARNQESQLVSARQQAAELTMQIETESLQVMHEFPEFDPNSPKYDASFAAKASELYGRAAGLKQDPTTGAYVAAATTPYQFYKDLHDMRESGMTQAQIKAQRAAEQQMAAVQPQPSNYQAKNDDSLESLEERLGDVRIA